MRIPIDNRTLYAVESLERAGYSAWFVGGCVRDAIMGAVPNDFDIATSASWQQTSEVFARLGCNVVETGVKHGTVTVFVNGLAFEITTYRIDGSYGDRRRPDSVRFTDNIEDDLARRDFRFNAIAYHPARGIFDPFDGEGDIERRVVCAVGDPEKRLAEDPLRIMRGLRFAAKLGFSIEEKTRRAIRTNAELLETVAKERILPELSGLICAPFASDVLVAYHDVIGVAAPFLNTMEPTDIERAACAISRMPADSELRFAAFFKVAQTARTDSKIDPARALQRLKAPRHFAQRVSAMCAQCYDSLPLALRDVARAVAAIQGDKEIVERALIVRESIASASTSSFDERVQRIRDVFRALERSGIPTCRADLAINGKDVATRSGVSGKEIGLALDRLLSDAIEGLVENERHALLERLADHTKDVSQKTF